MTANIVARLGQWEGMVASTVAGADRSELNRVYRQWRDGEDRAVENELHIAVWKFATTHAGDDLGHDVCLRVVGVLNRQRARRPAALPENLAAYIYEACRNANKDQKRQTWKYLPLSKAHIPEVPDPSDFLGDEDHLQSAVAQWSAIFERCRKSLPAPISKALDLDNFDLLAALGTTGNGSDVVRKRIQRARAKCL